MSDILREYLQEERKRNPSLNETSLSKRMNIPPTTLNRLLNGYSKPNIVTMLKLVQFIPELMKSVPSEVGKLLEVTREREKGRGYVGAEVEELLYDKNNFMCWILASLDKGVTKKEMKDVLGLDGEKTLNFLEKRKVISKGSDNRYRVIEKGKKVVLSFDLIKRHLQLLTEQYNLHSVGKRRNYIHYLVGNLNGEGVKQVMKVHQEAHRKVQEIMSTEECKGNISVFSTSCSDALPGA